MNLRAAAATVMSQVMTGVSLADALPKQMKHFSDSRDQAFLQALCYGVCRWYYRLAAILKLLLDKPLKAKDDDIYCLLLVGLYQLSDMRVQPYAAVAETVAATKAFKKMWAKNLVNAVLRNYQRRELELKETVEKTMTATFSHPDWMVSLLQKDWPDDWQAILSANNQHPPFSLRVNEQKITRAAYCEKLLAASGLEHGRGGPMCPPSGVNLKSGRTHGSAPTVQRQEQGVHIISETPSGILLTQPCDVESLPGFLQGEVSVQDGAAQLAAELLAPLPHQRVLDACAAPGGKTTHILEKQPHLAKLIALDSDATRLISVKENLDRLGLMADLICADAGDISQWWDGVPFDRILLDAPCSATGVIRRHPDIKLLRQAEDVFQLAKEQARLLSALWPTLKPNGLLVYATCSVYAEENVRVLSAFLAANRDANEEKIKAQWGKECLIGRQILPGMHDMDGFYFAVLRKH